MNGRFDSRYRSAFALLLLGGAVILHPTAAFKIPGLSNPAGASRKVAPAANGGGGGGGGEYMGPVFIIWELDKDAGLYDSFVTTGGIQEVKPPAPPPSSVKNYGVGGQQQQQQHKPAADEDSEYFGVLVTPETVRQVRFPKEVHINVSLSALLNAASSRMPWLLVLRRSDHAELLMGGDSQQQRPAQQQQQHRPTGQADPAAAGISPGMMQIPQRRRYYGADGRRRRSVDYRFGRAVPLVSERELLSTMCYNFAREYYYLERPVDVPDGRPEARIDADAYAAAAAASAEPARQPSDSGQPVPMTVPKRVS